MAEFDSLNKEKQDLIINAAIAEFTAHGYERASTNRIVEAAGISKGSLFQYFGNKEKLYLYLFDLAHDLMQKTLYDSVSLEEPDLFTRLEDLSAMMTDLLQRFPDTMNFMMNAKKETAEPVSRAVKERKRRSTDELVNRVFENIDTDLFRKDISFELIRYALLSCMETYFSQSVPFPGNYRTMEDKQKEFFRFCRLLFSRI